jgi:type I restriction enzyme S subunit
MRDETTQIKTEKQLVPVSRFKEFNDDWKTVTLFDLSENVSYGMNAAATAFDGVHKYLRITDIDEDSGTFKPRPLTSPEGEISEKFKLKKNDIVFTRTGASVGKPYLYNEKDGDLYYAGFLIKFSLTRGHSYFIYSLTQKEAYNKWVHVYSMRSGQPGLNAEEYKALKLTIPSLPEQQKIASFLSAVDEKIKQLSKKETLLKKYKKGVMQQLFPSTGSGQRSGQLRFKDENGKAYPDWEEKLLGELANINMGQSPESKSYNEDAIGLLLIQGNADINGRITAPRQYTSEPTKTCEIGDIILTVRAPVGSVSKSGHNACIGRGVCSIVNNTNSNQEYLFQFLLSYESKWGRLEQGSTFTAVSGKDIRTLKLNTPILEEQQKIASYLSGIDAKIAAVNTQITQTQTFKKGLLQQLFV